MLDTGIYQIRNTANGKRYVGSAVKFAQRWRQHAHLLRKRKHHSRILQNAWKQATREKRAAAMRAHWARVKAGEIQR